MSTPRQSLRVLVAPQEFKGSLSADEAAAAIAAGIRKSRPEWQIDVLPMSDGGPGFIDALRRAVRAETSEALVHDALGREVLGRYILIDGGKTAVVEAALANGLFHVALEERDPLRADSFGVGELIAAALRDKPQRLIVGVGGSATTDGGAGMARALGAKFLDDSGREPGPGGAELRSLARIQWRRPATLEGIEVVVATDVTNPLLGPRGAARVFAPQKGATPEQVDVLEDALTRFASVVRRETGADIASMPGGGAAGGLAAGLVAFLGARIESGFDIVAAATNLPARLHAADIVVTGEGRYDSQSLAGKVTGRIASLAAAESKRYVVFAGSSEWQSEDVRTLAELEPDVEVSCREAARLLEEIARRWAEVAGKQQLHQNQQQPKPRA